MARSLSTTAITPEHGREKWFMGRDMRASENWIAKIKNLLRAAIAAYA
jgi:hypothetical protein